MAWPFIKEDEFTSSGQSMLDTLLNALGSAPNDGTTAGMTPPSQRIIDFGRQAFFPDQDFSGPQVPELPEVVTQTVDALQQAFVPGANPANPANAAPRGSVVPPEERSLDDDIMAYQEAVIHAESALRGEVQPDKELTLELLTGATKAQSPEPVSVEKEEEIRGGLRGMIDRMNKNDRIDLLAAGLSMMQAASRTNSTGAAVATGLLSGMQEATRSRIERARTDVANRGVAAREAMAGAAVANAQTNRMRLGVSASQPPSRKSPTEDQRDRGAGVAKSMFPNMAEDSTEFDVVSATAARAIQLKEAGQVPPNMDLAQLTTYLLQQDNPGSVQVNEPWLWGDPSAEFDLDTGANTDQSILDLIRNLNP